MSYEWPLLIFTFLATASSGAFICGGSAQLLSKRTGSTEAAAEPRFPAAAFFGGCALALAVGLAASVAHLGSFVGAPTALLNLGSSWLSREILMGSLSLAGMAVTALLALKASDNAALAAWAVSVVVTVGFLVSAGNAYLLPTIPYWDTPATPLGLIAGALMAGCALTSATVLLSGKDKAKSHVRALAFAIAGAATFGLLGFVTAFGFGLASAAGPAGAASVSLATGVQAPLLLAEALCGAAGASLQAAGALMAGRKDREGLGRWLSVAGCALILVALLLARALFYSCSVNLQY